ncbi:MAG: hypothetical protein CSA58_05340 [Micrococcales bacterium]|nr:MAG: hypothetical protein CSB46_04480 [Micrococcales bacterium]PIE27209.1 MAG: hypothetical protein CSA58_05340 [Micrococcales bacterium]
MTGFRLTALLRLRTRQADELAGALAAAMQRHQDAEAGLVDAKRQLVQHRLGCGAAGAWAQSVSTRAALEEHMHRCEATTERTAAGLRQAQQDWAAARQRVKALERLRDKHNADRRAQTLAAEEQRAEMFVSARHAAAVFGGEQR